MPAPDRKRPSRLKGSRSPRSFVRGGGQYSRGDAQDGPALTQSSYIAAQSPSTGTPGQGCQGSRSSTRRSAHARVEAGKAAGDDLVERPAHPRPGCRWCTASGSRSRPRRSSCSALVGDVHRLRRVELGVDVRRPRARVTDDLLDRARVRRRVAPQLACDRLRHVGEDRRRGLPSDTVSIGPVSISIGPVSISLRSIDPITTDSSVPNSPPPTSSPPRVATTAAEMPATSRSAPNATAPSARLLAAEASGIKATRPVESADPRSVASR